jgi:acetylglutamate kinase
VKIGGRAQSDPALPRLLAQAARKGDELVVVHGGGDEVTALQRRLGSEPTFIGGRRVTTEEDMEIVRMVLSGAVNKRLVRQLLDEGVAAIGISGEDGGLLPALLLDGGALGAVGEPLVADARLRSGGLPPRPARRNGTGTQRQWRRCRGCNRRRAARGRIAAAG